MDSRNFFSPSPLQADMTDDWAIRAHAPLHSDSIASTLDIAPGRVASVAGEERELIASARAGDQDAFGTLVRLHQRQVYNLAFRMLRDSDEASEATQEVFLAAWQGLRNFRGDAHFSTWLYRIAYNYCLRLVEQRRRDASARAELVAQSAREQSPAGTLSAIHAHDAERQMREQVRGEIDNLPAKYRLVLVLRHLQDLSYEEMAEVMSVPIGTVKTQLFRARALLKERLEDLGRAKDERLSRAGDLRAGLAGLEAGLRGVLDRARDRPLQGGE